MINIENFMSCLVLSIIDIPANSLSPETLNFKPDPAERHIAPAEEILSGPCSIAYTENRAKGTLYESHFYTSPLGKITP